MSIFSEALLRNKTVKNGGEATINGDQVGTANFELWKAALKKAVPALYDYRKAVDDKAIDRQNDAPETVAAQAALVDLVNLIGEVNGRPLMNGANLVASLSAHVSAIKTTYKGEAETVSNRLACERAVRRTLNFNGVNPDLVATTDATIAELEARLKELSKQPDSANSDKVMANMDVKTHRRNFELAIAMLIAEQKAKSAAQIEAEWEAKRAERRAKTAAKRAAAKAAAAATTTAQA